MQMYAKLGPAYYRDWKCCDDFIPINMDTLTRNEFQLIDEDGRFKWSRAAVIQNDCRFMMWYCLSCGSLKMPPHKCHHTPACTNIDRMQLMKSSISFSIVTAIRFQDRIDWDVTG